MRFGHVWFGMAGMASSRVVSCAVDGSGVGLAGEVGWVEAW